MPAFIAHMLISRKVREVLLAEENPGLKSFVTNILTQNSEYMELGSIGPDLPCYNLVGFGKQWFIDKVHKPMGVDQWSYQLHSKDPREFPLKMCQVIWKSSEIDKDEWAQEDKEWFAFVCGFLTHVAADQIVHPVVNSIAGPYYKSPEARERHSRCEVFQDLYLLYLKKNGRLTKQDIKDWRIDDWCSLGGWRFWNLWQGSSPLPSYWLIWPWNWVKGASPLTFRHFLQKSLVEAHAVTPHERAIASWLWTAQLTVGWASWLKPYRMARQKLFTADGQLKKDTEDFKEFIQMDGSREAPAYDRYFDDAVKLAVLYVKATWNIYEAREMGKGETEAFRNRIINTDLGAPLDKNILADAEEAAQSAN